ncbi:histidine triad nucleotide-binding protein [Arhodomonas sp. AD133]|uniref:histidine triad nucleotide-binding protein n=1 Tax=Arhodomonas sp. AD133 TaxID=3415009 RepID=UPI003EBEC89E
MANIFEKIVNGELDADIVFQDDRVTAFRDIAPKARVHVLIVPNQVIETVDDIADEDEALIGHMVLVARDIARQEGIAEDGYRLMINCREHGGQEVYHLHLHLMGGQHMGPMVCR